MVYANNSESESRGSQASLSPDGRYLLDDCPCTPPVADPAARARRPENSENCSGVGRVSGEIVGRIKYEDIPGIAVFSPDAKHLVANDSQTLRVWEVTVGQEVAPIKYERTLRQYSARMEPSRHYRTESDTHPEDERLA